MSQEQKYHHPVIDALGGARALGRLAGVHASTVTLWARSGCIPTRHHHRLLEIAAEKGVTIGAGDWYAPPAR